MRNLITLLALFVGWAASSEPGVTAWVGARASDRISIFSLDTGEVLVGHDCAWALSSSTHALELGADEVVVPLKTLSTDDGVSLLLLIEKNDSASPNGTTNEGLFWMHFSGGQWNVVRISFSLESNLRFLPTSAFDLLLLKTGEVLPAYAENSRWRSLKVPVGGDPFQVVRAPIADRGTSNFGETTLVDNLGVPIGLQNVGNQLIPWFKRLVASARIDGVGSEIVPPLLALTAVIAAYPALYFAYLKWMDSRPTPPPPRPVIQVQEPRPPAADERRLRVILPMRVIR